MGVIHFSYLRGQQPGEDERVFLGAVADQAAVAVENARLFSEARGKAALEERQRLARELHDSVSQALYGIALGAQTARTLLDQEPDRATDPLDYVLSLAEAGRAVSNGLVKFTVLLKPRSNRSAAIMVRSLAEGEPSTTVTRRRPSRSALATTLNPAAQMKPVFMPSAPG